MKKTIAVSCVLFLLATLVIPVAASGAVYYVSPNGSDSASGSIAAPFRTVAKAVSVMAAGDTCYLREGVYRETISPKSDTVIIAYPGERPVISAMEELTGWQQTGDHLYSASMPLSLGAENMVLANGAFAYEARWPDNFGSLLYPTLAELDGRVNNEPTRLTDTAIPNGLDPTGAKMCCCGGSQWIFWTRSVSGFDPATKTYTLSSAANNTAYDGKTGNPYFLFGKREFLSSQNEWLYDSSSKKLLMWSQGLPTGIEIKQRQTVLDLSGKTRVTVDGLTMIGGRILSNASTSYCTVQHCTSLYAAHSFSSNVDGHLIRGHHNLFQNNEFAYASFTLIQDSGAYNRYINNYFHDMNYNSQFIGSVHLGGIKTLFSHNTVCDGGRELITLHYGKAALVQDNDLYHSSTLTWDTAAIYLNMTDGDNTVIRRNTVHDTVSSNLGMGIYLDPCSQNFIIYDNVIWNMTNSPIRLNNPCNYTLVYQNSSYHTGSMSSAVASGRSNGDLYGSRFVNNLFDGVSLSNFPDKGVFRYNQLGSIAVSPCALSYPTEEEPQLGTVCDKVLYQDPEHGDLRPRIPTISGEPLPGVSDGSFIGAYPYEDAELLSTGHDFSKHYRETYEFPNVAFMNCLRNAGFGYGDLRYWTVRGAHVSIQSDGSSWSSANATTRAGQYSVRLGAGVNSISQTVTGLKPHTEYTLSGWARTSGGSTVSMGVEELGLSRVFDRDEWVRQFLTFNTGDHTSLTVYYRSEGTGTSYCGDIGMAQPVLTEASAFAAQTSKITAEDLAPLSAADSAFYRTVSATSAVSDGQTVSLTLTNPDAGEHRIGIQLFSVRDTADGEVCVGIDTKEAILEEDRATVSFPFVKEDGTRVRIRLTEPDLLHPIGQILEIQ